MRKLGGGELAKLKPGQAVMVNDDAFKAVKYLPDRSVQLVFTSPPYPVHSKGFEVSPEEFADWMMPLMLELARALRSTGNVVINIQRYPMRSKVLYPWVNEFVVRVHKETPLKFVHDIIWHWPASWGSPGGKMPKLSYEHCLWFVKDPKRAYRNFWEVPIKPSESTLRTYERSPEYVHENATVSGQRFKNSSGKKSLEKHGGVLPYDIVMVPRTGISKKLKALLKKHQITTEYIFPYKLAAFFIYSMSREGDVVLDPFAGSGTTVLAAADANRIGVGIELDKKYYDLAVERIREGIK